jgi:aminoglycoside 6'-N-acetyltransferase
MFERIVEEGLLVIRRMEDSPDDYALLARWLTDERVLFYYEGRDNPFSIERVREKYAPRVLVKEGIVPCILVYENHPIGYLQFYPADIVEYAFDGRGKIFALDLFIGEPQFWNKGLGTRFLTLILRYLFEQQGADWTILDPHVDNQRAIRAYEKAGFRKLKLLRQHELHEGKRVDCWLMGIRWDEQS